MACPRISKTISDAQSKSEPDMNIFGGPFFYSDTHLYDRCSCKRRASSVRLLLPWSCNSANHKKAIAITLQAIIARQGFFSFNGLGSDILRYPLITCSKNVAPHTKRFDNLISGRRQPSFHSRLARFSTLQTNRLTVCMHLYLSRMQPCSLTDNVGMGQISIFSGSSLRIMQNASPSRYSLASWYLSCQITFFPWAAQETMVMRLALVYVLLFKTNWIQQNLDGLHVNSLDHSVKWVKMVNFAALLVSDWRKARQVLLASGSEFRPRTRSIFDVTLFTITQYQSAEISIALMTSESRVRGTETLCGS